MSDTDRQPYDVHGKLENPMVQLTVALGRWETRDDTVPQPEVFAAMDAMHAIDTMLRELQLLRARLASEIRQADDANAAR